MDVEPLAGVSPARLKPLLEEEASCWAGQLGWDFRPAADLIRKYVKSRTLPGYVLAGNGGELEGYAYYVVDQGVGYIGNLFVRRRRAGCSAYRTLLDRTLRGLRKDSALRRIECQLFPFNFDFPEVFGGFGFEIRPRHFLRRALLEEDRAGFRPGEGFAYDLVPWRGDFLAQAAQTVHDSYLGSADHDLCNDYQTVRGCQRFLRNLIESAGCGRFCGRASHLALDARGRVAAVLIASRIGPGRAMIPQLSVRREHQGAGLGTALLERCFQVALGQGLEEVCLSVSESNERAFRLYRRLGFGEVKRFHAYLWQRA